MTFLYDGSLNRETDLMKTSAATTVGKMWKADRKHCIFLTKDTIRILKE